VYIRFNRPVVPIGNYTLLEDGEVLIDGVPKPILDLTMIPSGSSEIDQLSFKWEVYNSTKWELVLQLVFTNPGQVSIFSEADGLLVTVNGYHLFKDEQGTSLDPEEAIYSSVFPPQIDPQVAKITQAASSALTGALGAGYITTFGLNILLAGSLSTLLNQIRYLQIVVHMTLVRLKVPANAAIYFGALLQVAAFDFVPTDNAYTKLFDIDDTPISPNFNTLGYETLQFLYNAGSLSLIIFLFLPYLMCIYSCNLLPVKRIRKFTHKQKKKVFFNGILTFLEESYMILCVCV